MLLILCYQYLSVTDFIATNIEGNFISLAWLTRGEPAQILLAGEPRGTFSYWLTLLPEGNIIFTLVFPDQSLNLALPQLLLPHLQLRQQPQQLLHLLHLLNLRSR